MTDKTLLRSVYKTETGFTDNGSPLGCTMYWDETGKYVGQEQMNCYDDGPSTLFFEAEEGEDEKYALVQEEIESAKNYSRK